MHLIKSIVVITVCLLCLGSCTEAMLMLHPHAKKLIPAQSLRHNFTNECIKQFDFSENPNADDDRCSDLINCLSGKTRGTPLDTYSSLSTFEKLKPPGSHLVLSIDEMQANAQKAGPKAITMANLVGDIRQQCLVETGLDQVYQ